jgi:malonyl CoA-acyl carrier protein transacylase
MLGSRQFALAVAAACIFPGQGSQSKGMGRDLFDRFPDWSSEADGILGYSVRELCLEDPRGELGLTAFTQPALFVVNAMTFRAWQERTRQTPAFLAGHSLGEYNALAAAGVFDFPDGLRLVRRRGELMGKVAGGGMAAVIGLPPARIEAVLGASEAGRRLDVANYNSFDQTVIAGPRDDLAAVEPHFKAAGVRAFIPLKVSAPFHSRYMREPMLEFGQFLRHVRFQTPNVPVVANLTGKPYASDRLRETLAEQMDHTVRWLDSVLFLLGEGITEFEEMGPGTVLARLTAQIRKGRGAADGPAV